MYKYNGNNTCIVTYPAILTLQANSTNLIPKLDEEWVGLISCLSTLIELAEQLPNFYFCVNHMGIITGKVKRQKGQERRLVNQVPKFYLRQS